MLNQLAGMQLEHRHTDGSWNRLQRSHHDPADHDPERDWVKGQIYSCSTCDEQIRVSAPESDRPGGTP
jgi:hypothetical protein